MEQHQSFKQWHSRNFVNKDKVTSTLSCTQPLLITLQCHFPSPRQTCFLKWKTFTSQFSTLELHSTHFRQSKLLDKATMSTSFAILKIKYLEHKNSVFLTLSNCYQESNQLLKQEKNAANSQNFQ